VKLRASKRGFNPFCTTFQNGLARSPLPLVQNNGA
jgi:hypothetical protein